MGRSGKPAGLHRPRDTGSGRLGQFVTDFYTAYAMASGQQFFGKSDPMRLAAAFAALALLAIQPALARDYGYGSSNHGYYHSTDGSDVHGPTRVENAAYHRQLATPPWPEHVPEWWCEYECVPSRQSAVTRP